MVWISSNQSSCVCMCGCAGCSSPNLRCGSCIDRPLICESCKKGYSTTPDATYCGSKYPSDICLAVGDSLSVSGTVALCWLSAPGDDCNFAAPKSREMSDVPSPLITPFLPSPDCWPGWSAPVVATPLVRNGSAVWCFAGRNA